MNVSNVVYEPGICMFLHQNDVFILFTILYLKTGIATYVYKSINMHFIAASYLMDHI